MDIRPAVIKEGVALAPYTTLKVGGVASYVAPIETIVDLHAVISWAKSQGISWRILGGGSNVLVSDSDFAGLVILLKLQSRTVSSREGTILVTYGAGMEFDTCVADSVAEGWWGLENLSHIPGTVGATPIQNVGAYGVEVADVIETVTAYDTVTGETIDMSAGDCRFAYRTSRFKSDDSGRYVVTAVTFRLSTASQPMITYKDLQSLQSQADLTPELIRQTVIAVRAGKFPDWRVVGTAGSFFKNPIIATEQAIELQRIYPDLPLYPVDEVSTKISLGYVLDKICGLRGYRHGRVRLYENQALVLVADAGATATEIKNFATEIILRVQEKINVTIEPEVVEW